MVRVGFILKEITPVILPTTFFKNSNVSSKSRRVKLGVSLPRRHKNITASGIHTTVFVVSCAPLVFLFCIPNLAVLVDHEVLALL